MTQSQPDEDDDLLDAGQEEVFSRAEVERGVIEHGAAAGRHRESAAERDEAQTARQAPDDAAPVEAAG
jgi:hypothetical protein